jgi:hypothetical protein
MIDRCFFETNHDIIRDMLRSIDIIIRNNPIDCLETHLLRTNRTLLLVNDIQQDCHRETDHRL